MSNREFAVPLFFTFRQEGDDFVPTRPPSDWPASVSKGFLMNEGISPIDCRKIAGLLQVYVELVELRTRAESELEAARRSISRMKGQRKVALKRTDDLCRQVEQLEFLMEGAYPNVPRPWGVRRRWAKVNVPLARGVYFGWCGGECVYVGSAVSATLRDRLTGSHHGIGLDDEVTWLEMDNDSDRAIRFAECFYIGMVRPVRNVAKPGLPADA